MATSTPTLVGREDELRRVDSFLDGLGSGPAALLVRGEPGIGKSSLWVAARSDALAKGMRVLSCRPTEAESAVSFLALHDLLDGTDDAVDRLAGPQREALEVALLRRPPLGATLDWRAVHVAVVEVVRALARPHPVLIAVDDLHWLDEGSSRILDHVAHRLQTEPVGFFATLRGSSGEAINLDLSTLPEGRVGQMELTSLSDQELERVVREHVPGLSSAHPIGALSLLAGGNPFYAIEIARAAVRGDRAPTGQRLPIPRTLRDDLLRDRLAALTDPAREALFIASALSQPTVDLVAAARDAGSVRTEVEAAEALGLIEIRGGEIRFSHPLFASAIYAEGTRDRRHRVHRRLAEIVEDPEQRARHRALGADEPDLDIVSALEAAALVACGRGSPSGAAELCTLASGLVPDDRPDRRREIRIVQSDFLIEAGDHDAAFDVLGEAVVGATGAIRTEILFRLARACFPIDIERTRTAITEALAEGTVTSLLAPRTAHLVPDVTEALIAAGEAAAAGTLVEWMLHRSAPDDWAAAAAAIRCRALLLASEGRLRDALAAIDASLESADELEAFDHARTLLVRGLIRRRATQKRAAREDLQRAFEMFRDVDAEAWMSLVQGEIAKISGRRPTPSSLTQGEARVALLAIAGLTNREIAGSLFMSVRTVEGHLSHSYAKLGVRSRTELAAVFER
jgi:DNA-binding CsgD family transcriptional regulator